jgi:hypothetical protein
MGRSGKFSRVAQADGVLAVHRVLQQSTKHLPHVLDVFTGDKGIGHPDKVTAPSVASSTFLLPGNAPF